MKKYGIPNCTNCHHSLLDSSLSTYVRWWQRNQLLGNQISSFVNADMAISYNILTRMNLRFEFEVMHFKPNLLIILFLGKFSWYFNFWLCDFLRLEYNFLSAVKVVVNFECFELNSNREWTKIVLTWCSLEWKRNVRYLIYLCVWYVLL
jgi:hypothetical protein